MSSYSSARTTNDVESDIDFSIYTPSSEFDLDFTFRGLTKPNIYEKEEDSSRKHFNSPESLLVLTAKTIALHFPFEVVESSPITVPEELQRLIAFHSFPTDEDDIWLYSCLSSGGSYEFNQGEALWLDRAVKECVQIGFHLSATVLTSLHIAPAFVPPTSNEENGTVNPSSADYFNPYVINFYPNDGHRLQSNLDNAGGTNENVTNNTNNNNNNNNNSNNNNNTSRMRKRGFNIEPDYPAHRVSLTFDRQRITSCSCTCTFDLEERCTAVASPSNTGENNVVNSGSMENIPLSSVRNSMRPNSFAYRPMNTTESNSGMLWQFGSRNESVFANCHTNSRQMPDQPNSYLMRNNCLLKNAPNQISPNSRRSWLYNQHIASQNNVHGDLMPTNGQNPTGTWCSHVVATCLMRIRQPEKVLLRAPISESLSKLSREDLQKFAQNLICHVGPRKILPAAQRILDQLLTGTNNPIKNSAGAPDPTLGGALGDAAAWCFDGGVLEEKLRVTLRRFWAPRPVLYSDIGSLSFNLPAEMENFRCILQSRRSSEPRGLWDLLSFIGNMMKRQDNNAVLLLEIVTRCILDMIEVMFWWCTVQTNPCHFPETLSVRQKQTQCGALWLCEEIVQLWRLACLNPELRPILSHANNKPLSPSPSSSSSSTFGHGLFSSSNCKAYSGNSWLLQQIAHRLQAFHVFALTQADYQLNSTNSGDKNVVTMFWCNTLGGSLFPNDMLPPDQDSSDYIPKNVSLFSGFMPALSACRLSWSSEVPPTYGLCATEFFKFMPSFYGAHITSDSEITDYANIILTFSRNYFDSMKHYSPIELDNYWNMDQINSQLFNNLPLPANHIEFAFSRFQAFDAHGYTEQALQWARYLALLLLYTSNEFINECEQVSFEIVGRIKYQTVSQSNSAHSNRNSNNINSQVGESSSHIHESYPNNNFQSNNQQKSTSTNTVSNSLIAGSSGAAAAAGGGSIPGGNSSNTRKNARNSRSKKATTSSTTVNSNRETTEKYTSSIKLHPLFNKLSIEYTAKAIRWLDQIRCVMECLSRSHDEFVSNTPSSSINGNTFNIKQTLRGLYTKPTRFETTSNINYNNLRAAATTASNSNNNNNNNNEANANSNTNGSNTNSTNDHNRQTEDRNADFIKSFDAWKCIDIELAFRLGFCALKFPRPPCCSPLLEVELFDMEVGLLNRLCLLPIHIACPHVISSIRNEAKQVISGLTLHQKDILVPFNLVTYLFHQLVGVSSSYRNPLCPRVVNLILSLDQNTENVTQNMNTTGLLNILACPILTTGAVLNGSGLPLAMEIYNLHNDMRNNSPEIKKTDYNINVRITSDAELGLQSVISVLGVKSRVPEKLFTYFIEGQRAQEDALALYLFHVYRDDIPKLDRILARLLDRYYNPHFKSPPLWACLNLDSRELMNFQSFNIGYNSVPEMADIIKHENKSFAAQNSATASNTPPNTISTATTAATNNSVKLNSLSTMNPVTNPGMSSMSNSTFQSLNHLTEVETVVCGSSSSNNNNNNNDKISPVTEINCKESDDINTGVDEVTPRIPEDKYAYSDMPDTSPVSDGDNLSNKVKQQYTSVNNLPLSFDPVSVSEDTDTLSDSKLDNLRCAALCDPRRRLCHFSAVDTSAPETTSSDNSPDAIRRLVLVGQKSSAAAYTTESSDGGCGDIAERYKQMSINDHTSNSVSMSTTATLIESKNYNKHENDKQISMGQSDKIQSSRSPPSSSSSSTDVDDDGGNECISTQIPITKQLINNDNNTKPCQANYFQNMSDDVNVPSGSHSEIKSNTKRNTNSCRDSESYPLPLRNLSATTGPFRLRIGWHSHLKRPPPQPLSDSMAFHVFQLAKKIREGACGPSGSGSMFVAEPEANDTVHRNLQLVSFQLGLYGLGLFNGLLPSWQNRTFSRNGGWISQQVFEIGIPAACILYHSWQQHLTASELAAISFQLSRENNRLLVDIAAELCLASLSLCNVLRPQELYRALEQCGEHSSMTLERGLLCTEKSVHQSSHGTLPEIYFFLARSWFSLYHSVTKEHEQALNSLDSMNLNQQLLSKIASEGNSIITSTLTNNTPPLSCNTTITTTNTNTAVVAAAATITGNSTCNTLLSEGNVSLSNSAIPVREINNNNNTDNNINTNNTSGVQLPPLCGSTDMGSVGNSNSLNSDLTNAWNYYQSVNLFQPPILRPDHHQQQQQQQQQQPFMYPPSVYPIHPNYSSFSLRQQPQQQQQPPTPQFPPFPYYLNMFNLQQTQPPSQPQTQQQQQQTNNLLNANNSQPQLQSTHHVPCYLPQTQLVSSPNTSYPFGIPSMPQATPLGNNLASVPVQKLPGNYFLHPQFIPNANHPTSPSSQSANLIQSSPFVTIAHQINPSSSLSPTISNNILPCNSYQTYPTDQVIDPSVYAYNPTMVIPNIHPTMVCNVLSNPPQQQQQHQQSVESITPLSSSSINNYNNNGCINTLNLNAITDATVISGNSLSSVISSALTSTCQLTTSSTASSSIVVHPSMSDQGSILSEGDSCRLTESIADGLGDENNPNSNNSNGSNEASLNNKEKLSNTSVKSTLSELQALEVKAQTYLVKAFFCAKCAIKKMSVNQSGTSTNFNRQNNTIVVSMPSKNMRGKHYYHMQQNHRGNVPHHFQRRYATQNDAPSSSSSHNNNGNNHNSNNTTNNNGSSVANNIRSNLINDEVNASNCISSENSSSWYFMPSVSSSCGSNQIKVPSSVSAYFNLTNSTTSKSCDSHILWTLDVASSLGPMAVNEYCNLVLQCVTCPLLMEQITARVIDYYEKRMKENTSTTTGTVCGGGGPSVGNSCVSNAPITNPSFDQQNYFGIQSSNEVISETADKNINFCPNTSRNFADHSHMPNQLWTTLPSMTTSNWPINTNVQNPQDFIPIMPVPYSHSDPNNMASSFNYHSFLPPSIHPSNIPWSHSTGPMNYPVLQQNLYSNQLQENICQFQQMNLNSELNINSNSYINSNKPNNLGHPLNRPPYQTPIQWQMNAQPYIRPFLQNYAYTNSVTPPAATTSSHTNYTGTDEQTKPNANEFTGRDVVEMLINQTHTLFQKYIGQRLQFIGQSQAEWDEFVDLVLKAYNVHLSMPAIDCGLHWNNLLTRIRRHQKCSPALWQRILAGIQTADLKRTA